MRTIGLVLVLLSIGCATAPTPAPTVAAPQKLDESAVAAADAAVLSGCYDCLLDARTTLERLAIGPLRVVLLPRLFEVNLLLALRQKELALDPSETFNRARALLPDLPHELDGSRYLGIADAVPPDDAGTPRQTMRVFNEMHAGMPPQVDADLDWLTTATLREPVREYLAIALACSYPIRPHPSGRTAEAPPWPTLARAQSGALTVPPAAPALIRYRVSVCLGVNQPALEQVRADVPRFAEVEYPIGRIDTVMAETDGGMAAAPALAEAYARFPTSPAVTQANGGLQQKIGDCEKALRFYNETLALAPGHESAWLGRVVCLTYLKRSADAILAATQMVDLGLDNIADAYYWRAWNQHVLGALEAARADIERAKTLKPRDGDVLTLAGVIEYGQNDLAPAETDLRGALALGGAVNCTAEWYLGAVYTKSERWPESAARFTAGVDCYAAAMSLAETRLAAVKSRPDIDPAFQARQVTTLEAEVTVDRSQRYTSAFNAATAYAHVGDMARARELVALAAEDPTLADLVKALREALPKPPAE